MYQRRQNKKPHWGQVKETADEEDDLDDESMGEEDEDDSEDQPEVYEGIGRSNIADLDEDNLYEEQEKLRSESKRLNLDDLKSGIQSLIMGTSSVVDSEIKNRKPSTMPPLPTDSRPLYEILPEVKTQSSNDIYSSGHGYAMPTHPASALNLQQK